jgi:hypothetical protein
MRRKITVPSLSLIATALFGAAEAFLWWMYNYKWFDRESIGFLATITAGGFALFAYLKGIEEKRSRAADAFIRRWNNPSLRKLIDTTRPLVQGERNSAELARPNYSQKSAPAQDVILRGRMQTILGFFEEIAISVFAKTADEDKLFDFFKAVIPKGYEGFEGFILAERKTDNDKEYYRKAQKLVERWTDTHRRDL